MTLLLPNILFVVWYELLPQHRSFMKVEYVLFTAEQ